MRDSSPELLAATRADAPEIRRERRDHNGPTAGLEHDESCLVRERPYTEGLTFAVVLAGLWRTHDRLRNPSWLAGVEIGICLARATLCHKQMFFLTLAATALLLAAMVASREYRRRYADTLVGTIVAFVIVCAPDWHFKSTLFPDMSIARFLRWDQNQHTNVLSPLGMVRESNGIWDYLPDRASGFRVAFGQGRMSYTGPEASPHMIPKISQKKRPFAEDFIEGLHARGKALVRHVGSASYQKQP